MRVPRARADTARRADRDVCRPSGDVVAREIEGESIIVPLVAGSGDMEDELFTLNDTGKAIWDQFDGRRVKAGCSMADEGRESLPDGARRHVPCSPGNWRSAGAGSTILGCLPGSLGYFTSAARAAGPADGVAGAAPLSPGRQRCSPHSRLAQDRSPAP